MSDLASAPDVAFERALKLPPGPRGYPVVGIAPMLKWKTLPFMVQASRDFGGVVSLGKGMFLVSDPAHVQYILEDKIGNFRKNNRPGTLWGGQSLALSEDGVWEQQRRRLQTVFQRQNNTILAGRVVVATERMLDRWQARVGRKVEVEREMVHLVLEALVETMFGAGPKGPLEELTEAIHTVHSTFDRRAQATISLPMSWPTPANRSYRRSISFLETFIKRSIRERRDSGASEGDLLAMLIAAKDPETGEEMSDAQLYDEVLMLLVLGHQTAAMALTWTWYALSRFPRVESEVRREIATAFGDRVPAPDEVARLPYLRQVLSETLRLYPPTWMIARMVLSDDQLGGYDIPAHSLVVFGPYLTHRQPEIWERPEEFDPDRFSPQRSAGRHRFAYFPFGGGPRRCIAGSFAMMELPLILARVIQHYRLHRPAGRPVGLNVTLVLRPRRGLKMGLERVAGIKL
jgi:cytochrome P450